MNDATFVLSREINPCKGAASTRMQLRFRNTRCSGLARLGRGLRRYLDPPDHCPFKYRSTNVGTRIKKKKSENMSLTEN
ncbi:hypothetical protein PUN28_006934 [Cardiocondyla obscurior]|uniref:Uncharacterized protein n=1 Tax=Cardiocondyla obscurior TaxID=286306 RepID=A0AAW2G3N6_9HYME